MQERPNETKSLWTKAPVPNLFRYVPSGIYYARFRCSGKEIKRSLKTDRISVAKLRLVDVVRSERIIAESGEGMKRGRMTFGDAMAVYRERIQSDSNLKPRSKSYRQQTILAISKSWPGIEEIDIRKISKSDCLKWAAAFRQTGTRFRARGAKTDHVGISPERFNNTVGSLRAIFQIAVDAGARYGNPAVEIKKARIRARELKLPTKDQFAAFVREIEGSGAAQAKDCADLVRFLTFTGCRIGEASFLKWEDIDDATSELIVRGDPKTATKNWEIRRIPIIPELRPFLIQLRARRLKGDSTEKILKVRECQKAMDRAANIVKTTRITHHDLRHLFATTCIESGVDIPTVSRWLGHKDGGALAMKVYGHLRNEHSAAQAQRVRFSV
ncbi:MAG: hypothetical protein QOD99_1185 [Chthoniobacter sp.]|nr:hypothetical protein [Chthoniobacter sp.]